MGFFTAVTTGFFTVVAAGFFAAAAAGALAAEAVPAVAAAGAGDHVAESFVPATFAVTVAGFTGCWPARRDR